MLNYSVHLILIVTWMLFASVRYGFSPVCWLSVFRCLFSLANDYFIKWFRDFHIKVHLHNLFIENDFNKWIERAICCFFFPSFIYYRGHLTGVPNMLIMINNPRVVNWNWLICGDHKMPIVKKKTKTNHTIENNAILEFQSLYTHTHTQANTHFDDEKKMRLQKCWNCFQGSWRSHRWVCMNATYLII